MRHPSSYYVLITMIRRDSPCKSLSRSLRNKSSKDVALPHPQTRKDHYRKEDIPSREGIAWQLFKRTIDIAEYRNTKEDVNPAKNRTLGCTIHGRLREHGWWVVLRSMYKFRSLASHETLGQQSKIPHRCDTQKQCRSGDHKRVRRRVL